MKHCDYCGHDNKAEAQYCGCCGGCFVPPTASVSPVSPRSRKAKIGGLLLVLLFVLLLGLLSPLSTVLLRPYDAARLKIFAYKIAGTDRVVATAMGRSLAVEIKGPDVPKIVREVSSAKSARLQLGKGYACIFGVKATFYRGTNALDFVEMCGSLLMFHNGAPYEYGPGALRDSIYNPVIADVLNR